MGNEIISHNRVYESAAGISDDDEEYGVEAAAVCGDIPESPCKQTEENTRNIPLIHGGRRYERNKNQGPRAEKRGKQAVRILNYGKDQYRQGKPEPAYKKLFL